jgi:hypothetical protein
LESGLDAIVVAHGRLLYRRYSDADADANADAWSYTHADTDTGADTDAHADSRPGMRRGSNLDCDRDLYWRSAGATERHSL